MDAINRAAEADRQGLCIVCGKAEEDRRRGLCTQHYNQFRTALTSVPAVDRRSFEDRLVESGRLLPSRQGQRNVENVFADELAKFLAGQGQGSDPPPPVDSGAEVLRRVEQLQEGVPKEKKVKGRGRQKKKGE